MHDTPAARILANANFHLTRLAALRRPLNRDEERIHNAYTALLEKRKEANGGPSRQQPQRNPLQAPR